MVLILQGVNLLGGEAGVGEHSILRVSRLADCLIIGSCETYLLNDVLPCARCLEADQLIIQCLSHGLNARAHDLQILVPIGHQLIVGQNLLNNAAANPRTH